MPAKKFELPTDLHPELSKLGAKVLKTLHEKRVLVLLNDVLKSKSNTKLNLKGKALRGSDFESFLSLFQFMDHVEELDLSGNDFPEGAAKELGKFLDRLKNLKSLNLQDCYFGDEGISAIQLAMKKLVKLESLMLYHNNLGLIAVKHIAQCLKFYPNLKLLDLGSSEMGLEGAKAISEQLKKLKFLEDLNLHNCGLGKDAIEVLVSSFALLQKLKKLTLSTDNLDGDACSHLSPCLEALSGLEYLNIDSAILEISLDKLFTKKLVLPNLKTLKMSSNDFSEKVSYSAIAQFLTQCPGLEDLQMGGCKLGNDGISAIAPSLESLKELKKFIIPTNTISATGCRALGSYIGSLVNLEFLDLHKNEISSEGLLLLLPGLSKLPKIKEFNFEGTKIGYEAFDQYVKSFENNHIITVLNLQDCALNTKSGGSLKKFLIEHPKLENLNLSSNEIDLAAFELFASQLELCPNLQYLSVEKIKLETNGLRLFCNSIKKLVKLKTLVIRECAIGPEGGEIFATVIEDLIDLEGLDLSDNGLGPKGMCAIAPKLCKMKKLQNLLLNRNNFGPEGSDALVTVLPELDSLKMLDVRFNKILNMATRRLVSAICDNNIPLDYLTVKKNGVYGIIKSGLSGKIGDKVRGFEY